MTAIRVWIEKQFYLCNPKDDKLKAGRTIGGKISYLFPRNAKNKWVGSNKIIEVIQKTSKKVKWRERVTFAPLF